MNAFDRCIGARLRLSKIVTRGSNTKNAPARCDDAVALHRCTRMENFHAFNSLGNLDPMAEGYETGLGFLTGVAIDQHFSQRGRLPDMTALVDTYTQLLGIGLDEAASILVQGSIATCYSRDGRHVYFYDRRKPVVSGQPDYVRLANGEKFDLAKREIVESRGQQHHSNGLPKGDWELQIQ